MVYLDYAAATPVDDRVLAAMQPYWQEKFYNPSALYTPARSVADELQQFRQRSARALGVKSREVYFTAGATEANNLAIAGLMQQHLYATMATSTIEHDSVRRPAHAYASVKDIGVHPDGVLRVEDVASVIEANTVLLSIEYVNSEIGTIQPVRDISRLVSDVRAERKKNGNKMPLYLHTDASQAAGRMSMDLSRLGVDMATINGGKIYGPKQGGILYVKRGIELEPLLHGGGQERGVRTGTENVAFAAGMATALELADNGRESEHSRLQSLQKQLLECVEQLGGVLNGSRAHRVPDNIHVSFPDVDGETLVHHLDARDIQAATGSACSANDDTPDHVLVALGLEEKHITGSLRITLGRDTSPEDIAYVKDVLADRIPKLREG